MGGVDAVSLRLGCLIFLFAVMILAEETSVLNIFSRDVRTQWEEFKCICEIPKPNKRGEMENFHFHAHESQFTSLETQEHGH